MRRAVKWLVVLGIAVRVYQAAAVVSLLAHAFGAVTRLRGNATASKGAAT
jgi:hypothetical protein